MVAEGEGLLPMFVKLMEWNQQATEAPPQLLYVDCDCCFSVGKGKAAAMFHECHHGQSPAVRPPLLLRLQVGRGGCGPSTGGLTDAGSCSRPTVKELAWHCRLRRKRGAQETELLIQELTDTMGIRLLDRKKMEDIWQTQRHHLHCIQDPPGVQLYRRVRQVTRGGLVLPVYLCACSSTSLESFHLHLNPFIPGTSASALHFQSYLLERLVRWNEDRIAAAVEGSDPTQVCYSSQLQYYAEHQLSKHFLRLQMDYTRPGEYTSSQSLLLSLSLSLSHIHIHTHTHT
ncbi:uncharacterized protein LOC118241707 [Electrophorus electricus]|uniref:uncharacterized protein LOC118241707 n=1 Tax=Electrophorus electricus TaxID=8005 RepID=UPI0015CFE6CF|nr:uncharacterized protein LOC118241707 [Electrophorus electricus]